MTRPPRCIPDARFDELFTRLGSRGEFGDARDAVYLVRLLRLGEITRVTVPKVSKKPPAIWSARVKIAAVT